MKIADNGEFSVNNSGMWVYNMPITELGDSIYINGQGHTKTDLKPVFGNFKFTQNQQEGMMLHNQIKVGFSQGSTNYKAQSDSGVWYNTTMHRTYLNLNNNGQVDAIANTDNKKWQLTNIWESGDYLYYNEYNGSDQETCYKINRHTMEIELAKSHDDTRRRLVFIHEDEEYLYGYNACHIHTNYPGMFYMKKDDLVISRWGLHRQYNYGDQVIYKDDDYLINFHWEFNYTSSRPSFLVNKLHFNDSKTTATGYYRRKDGANVNYGILTTDIPNDAGGYDDSNYNHHRINYTLSDGNLFTPKSGFYAHAGIGIVNDSTLRNTHKIARFYVPYIDESDETEPLSFLRVNVPIGENIADHYTFDVRKCNVTINGGDGSLLQFVNQGHLDNGNSTYAYRDIRANYFEDNGKSYLFVYISDSSGVYMDNKPTMTPTFYVFRIKNHASSLTDNKNETTSIDLELIQTNTEDYGTMGVFYPGGYSAGFKKFVWVQLAGTKNPIYEWNRSSQKFVTEKNKGIYGDIMEIGEDSQGRIWTLKWPNTSRRINRELHLESLDLARRVEVRTEKDTYDYQGTDINSNISVSAYDHEDNRVAVGLTLNMIGSGIVFSSNNSTSISLTTLTTDDNVVPIKITGPTSVDISATITSGV
jgi:hypothetical protein